MGRRFESGHQLDADGLRTRGRPSTTGFESRACPFNGSLVQWSREAQNGGLLSRVSLVRFQQGPPALPGGSGQATRSPRVQSGLDSTQHSRERHSVSGVAVNHVLVGSSPAPGAIDYGTESMGTRERTPTPTMP